MAFNFGQVNYMTEQQLARSLVQAGLLTTTQVQTAAAQRGAGRKFADIVTEEGWVTVMDVLQFDPTAFDHRQATGSSYEEPVYDAAANYNEDASILDSHDGYGSYDSNYDNSGYGETYTQSGYGNEYQNGAAEASNAAVGIGQDEARPPLDGSGVIIMGEEESVGDIGTTVLYCNQLLQDAVIKRASDIHLEPREDGLLVRYRIDGHLRSNTVLSPEFQAPVISRFKVLSELDIAENRMPQDGRFRAVVGGRIFDFRVSSLPTIHGEKIVIRLLDRSSLVTDLRRLGFSDAGRDAFEKMLRSSHGMILVTGPTGSGKTTTLYASLAAARDDTKNVITVEDPVEYELSGVTQTAVRAEIGLTFATQLRAILRQDPDVILVGEIRDNETADIAVRAALTGHLVLSTLHTNSAVSAITRLQDMDVPPFLIASSLNVVVAQRLVRIICRQCREVVPPDEPGMEELLESLKLRAGTPIYRGAGCSECNNSGTRGRIAVLEVLQVDREMRKAIMAKADATSLRQIAIGNGMRTLWQDGIDKLLRGITTAEEVTRVLLGSEEMDEA